MVEWSNYCEHCGTTAPPVRRIAVNVKLEGTIRGDERDDRKPYTSVESDDWVCSECGRKVKVYGD